MVKPSVAVVLKAYSGIGKKSGKPFTSLTMMARNDEGKFGELVAFAQNTQEEADYIALQNGDAVEVVVEKWQDGFKTGIKCTSVKKVGIADIVARTK